MRFDGGSSPTCLHLGNRCGVFLHREAARVEKRLLPFANVAPERSALAREARLQALLAARVRGIVPVKSPLSASECSSLWRPYVEGSTLKEWAEQRFLERSSVQAAGESLGGRSFAPTILRIAGELASILAGVHGEGIVHRDLSLSNVFLSCAGRVWLNDFGLARLAHDPPLADDQLGQGTRRILPPEVLAGKQPGPAADVYAWGKLVAGLLEACEEAGQKNFPEQQPARDGSSSPFLFDEEAARERLRLWGWETCLAAEPKARPSTTELAAACRDAARRPPSRR